MPMETAINAGIRPVDRPQTAGKADGVTRQDSGSTASALTPKTNVAIETAIGDMAGILNKIASSQVEAAEKMPDELQKMLQNVLKQAFSLPETLGQGLGSTIESQRFTLDQLSAFSRMLSQLGNLAENGIKAGASDEVQTLLTNLKNIISSTDGTTFEPVLLTKAAFELLDNKNFADLPKAMQQLLVNLQPQGQAEMVPVNVNNNSLGFLKQLVEYMMPRPAIVNLPNASQSANSLPVTSNNSNAFQTSNTANNNVSLTANNTSNEAAKAGTIETVNANNANNASNSGNVKQVANTPANVSTSEHTTVTVKENSSQTNINNNGNKLDTMPAKTAAQNTGSLETGNSSAAAFKNATVNEASSLNQSNAKADFAANKTNVSQEAAVYDSKAVPNEPANTNSSQREFMQHTKMVLLNQNLENTPKLMDTLKSLARFLLNDTNLTTAEQVKLQNFIASGQAVLKNEDAKELQSLIKLCQSNIPATVQQAAIKHDIPDLPRLWAFMQLCDMTAVKKLSAKALKKASHEVATFVLMMRNSIEGDNSLLPAQRSLNFMLPMYMGADTTYPTYIHVYDENRQDRETGIRKKETWLRICFLTDNIGAVEMTCRVYNGNQLDIKLFFASNSVAKEFQAETADIRAYLRQSSLQLKEFKIGAADS